LASNSSISIKSAADLHGKPGGKLTILIVGLAAGLEIDENIRKIVHIRAVKHANLSLFHGQ
jgi:hypothetical protein